MLSSPSHSLAQPTHPHPTRAHTQQAAFTKSVFGQTLTEILDMQRDTYPDEEVPHIVHFLTEAILELDGKNTEGLFRVPGDADAISDLRAAIDKGTYSTEGVYDANVPASLLKLWMRELAEPLIPESFYADCVKVGKLTFTRTDKENYAAAKKVLDALPDASYRVAMFMIDFLFVRAAGRGCAEMCAHMGVAFVRSFLALAPTPY
jgi:hypothetical protein